MQQTVMERGWLAAAFVVAAVAEGRDREDKDKHKDEKGPRNCHDNHHRYDVTPSHSLTATAATAATVNSKCNAGRLSHHHPR